jgi:hypothetical protein
LRLPTTLLVLAVAAGGGPTSPDRPSHRCAAACVGPCLGGGPCDCDGRTCLVDLVVPGSGVARLRVENRGLPPRPAPCPDRPLSAGRTYRRDPSVIDQAVWICNDPDCPFHRGENGAFRGRP